MTRLFVPLMLAALALPGCKIVPTPTADSAAADPIAALAAETFAPQLIPHIVGAATPLPDLRTAIAAGLDAAGETLGHRGAGQGAAWNFAVSGEGTIVSANLESRARKLEVDTDGDGAADVTLQIGPVIQGTALRDVAPLYDFGDFRDQIEFAQLGRALNELATAAIMIPEGDPVGHAVTFTGVLPLRSATEAQVVTAVTVEVAP